jgi:hypothetical protein
MPLLHTTPAYLSPSHHHLPDSPHPHPHCPCPLTLTLTPQELALLEYCSLAFPPSALAAAALILAQLAQRQAPASELLSALAGHSMDVLREAADLLMRLHYLAWSAEEGSPAQPLVAVRVKYDAQVFCQASRLPPAVAYGHLPSRGR